MNILILNGSPRNNGATAKILRAIEKQLKNEKDFSIEYINLKDLKMSTCIGCCSCYKTGSCFIKDDAELLSHKIADADGLIIGSPTYASNISSLLKQFVDRGHFVIEQLLHKKYAISVVTGENYGNNDTSKILTKLLKYSGARLSGKIVHTLPFDGDPLSDTKLQKKILFISKKICNDIQNQKGYPIQDLIHRLIFSFGIKPFVIRKGDSYTGVVSRWNQKQILK